LNSRQLCHVGRNSLSLDDAAFLLSGVASALLGPFGELFIISRNSKHYGLGVSVGARFLCTPAPTLRLVPYVQSYCCDRPLTLSAKQLRDSSDLTTIQVSHLWPLCEVNWLLGGIEAASY
jgi:hypothetical protein